jgi:hypothetical protein
MVYFMQAVGGGPVKIGYSADVAARVKQLEVKYGQELVILSVIPGGRDKERELHSRFSEIRFGRTEQFKPTAELMDFIGLPLFVSANPDAVELMLSHEKPVAFQIRVSEEYKAVLEEAAAFDGKSVVALIDHAIRWYARLIGFPESIPKR